MKQMFKALMIFSFLLAGSANAAFVGDYDVANWTQIVNAGSIDTSGAPNSVVLTSSDDWSGMNKSQDFVITAAQNSIVSFAWSFSTTDWNPSYDPFGTLLNGVFSQLSVDGGLNQQSGVYSFFVSQGDVFGFRANSRDSMYGSATTTVSNFNAAVPAAVPVPAALWLFVAPLIGLMAKKRKIAA